MVCNFLKTLKELGFVASEDVNELTDEIFALGKDLKFLNKQKELNTPSS